MIVHVHHDRSITLDDPNGFDAFSVRAPGLALDDVVAAFEGDAMAADEPSGEARHVWITIARLHALGAEHGAPDWRSGCDAMIAFAKSKGWLDETGRSVRAHLEPDA